MLEGVNWAETKAYSFGSFGNICINVRGREPLGVVEPGTEYERLRDCITEEFLKLRDPRTGESIGERAYRREEIYQGPCLESMPDLLLMIKDFVYTTRQKHGAKGDSLIDVPPDTLSGHHRPNGVFIAHGPNVRAGLTAQGARIIDVAPTVLQLMGNPVPDDMDGRVLIEMFVPEFLEANPIKYCKGWDYTREEEGFSEEERAEIEKRLEALGYLG
jgi:predicted AlkP superfamily phosphohydrolase/phosphomutase